MDNIMQGIGLAQGQQGAQGPPAIGGYQPMTGPELLLRSIGGVTPYVAHAMQRRYPTVGSTIAQIGTGLAGSFAGTAGEELGRQRLDPVSQQLRVAQQLQDLGTAPLAPTPLGAGTQFALPVPGQPATPPAPLTPGPGIPGQPTFDISKIPAQYQIAFAKDLAPLQQMATAKQQMDTAKAQEDYLRLHGTLTQTEIATNARKNAEADRQSAADNALRTWMQNPVNRARPTFAVDLANQAVGLGADPKIADPVINAMDKTAQIAHYDALNKNMVDTLAQHKIDEANLQANRADALKRGDIADNMKITNDQLIHYDSTMRLIDNTLKANDARAKTLSANLSDPLTDKKDIPGIRQELQDIKDARGQLRQQYNEYEGKKNAADSDLKTLQEQTPTGKKIAAQRPPAPPTTEVNPEDPLNLRRAGGGTTQAMPVSAAPTTPPPIPGSFAGTPAETALKQRAVANAATQQQEAKILSRARVLARNAGMNPNAAAMFLGPYIEQARRELSGR